MKWEDTTSYSKGERGIIAPKTWTIRYAQLSICVTCGHIYHRPNWVMHCHMLGVDTYPLPGVKTADEAQSEAIMVARNHIDFLSEALSKIEDK